MAGIMSLQTREVQPDLCEAQPSCAAGKASKLTSTILLLSEIGTSGCKATVHTGRNSDMEVQGQGQETIAAGIKTTYLHAKVHPDPQAQNQRSMPWSNFNDAKQVCGHRAGKEHFGPNGAAASILITHVGRKKQDRQPRIVRTTTASI